MDRPASYPDFAMTDVIDPTSGQPNVFEPGTPKKNTGWVYNEKPPRQFFNWLQRFNSLWIRFFDSEEWDGTFDIDVFNQSPQKTITCSYRKRGNVVQILIPATTGIDIGGTGNFALMYLPADLCPASTQFIIGLIVVNDLSNRCFCSCIIGTNGTIEILNGVTQSPGWTVSKPTAIENDSVIMYSLP